MSPFNTFLLNTCQSSRDMLCKVLFDLSRYNNESEELASALIEGMEYPVLIDSIKPNAPDNIIITRDNNLGYRIVAFLLENGQEGSAVKLVFHFQLDVNFKYSELKKDSGLCLMTQALRYDRQYFLDAIIIHDYFDPHEDREVSRLCYASKLLFDSLNSSGLISGSLNHESNKQYVMAKSVSSFLLRHYGDDVRRLKEVMTWFMPVLSADMVTLVPFISGSIALSDISDGMLSKATKNTCDRLMCIRLNESRLSDYWKQRNNVHGILSPSEKQTKKISNYNQVRRMLITVRKNRELEKELLRAVSIFGNDKGVIKCLQKGMYEIIKEKWHGFYVNSSFSELLSQFCKILDCPIVPGSKVSPIVNMEWFVNNYRSKVVTEGIGLHHMVDCIRTTKQLNMVCRAYDISPSTLLIMHGDKLKPSMRHKCLGKIA